MNWYIVRCKLCSVEGPADFESFAQGVETKLHWLMLASMDSLGQAKK